MGIGLGSRAFRVSFVHYHSMECKNKGGQKEIHGSVHPHDPGLKDVRSKYACPLNSLN